MRNVVGGRRQQMLAAFLMGLILALLAGSDIAGAQAPGDGPELRPGPGQAPGPGSEPEPAPGDVPAPRRTTWVGYDMSWPQCGGPYPEGPVAFAIIGVTGGRPFTENRCLADEYRWARQGDYPPEVYINVAGWKRVTLAHFFGPAGLCGLFDEWCKAYNYGWNTARHALDYGRSQGVDATRWWLDVETMNYWSPDIVLNARIIGGALDYLERQGLDVGICSTPYQWGIIAGAYAPGRPVWTAGARDLDDARSRCDDPRFAFAGGRVELVQWIQDFGHVEFDMNYACP